MAQEASWKRVESYSGFLPKVSVGANRLIDKQYMLLDVTLPGFAPLSIPQVMPTTNYSLTASWLVFDGLANVERWRSAKQFESAASEQLEWTQFRARREVILQYYRALAAHTLREVAEQNAHTLQDHLSETKLFKKVGVSTNFDLLRVEVQLSEAQSEVGNSLDNETLSVLRLADITNHSYDGREVTGELPVLDQKLVEHVSATTAERKDLAALEARSNALDHMSSASSRQWYPKVALYAEYDRYNNHNDQMDYSTTDFRDARTIGVQLNWALFDGLAPTAQAHEAKEQKAQADYNFEMLKQRARTDLEFWRRKFTYFATVYHARVEDVAKSTESVRLAREGRKVGSRTNTDLLDAESELFHARAGMVNSQIGAIEALINFELSLGRQIYKFE